MEEFAKLFISCFSNTFSVDSCAVERSPLLAKRCGRPQLRGLLQLLRETERTYFSQAYVAQLEKTEHQGFKFSLSDISWHGTIFNGSAA